MTQVREHWGSRLGFVLAAVGSAVGLGVLWKFPYTVGENGGGLFLFTYFLCVLVIGIPVLIGELLLGRRSQRAAVGAFGTLAPKRPQWKAAGWFGVLSSFLIMSFYSVIAGWGMSYILMSLSGFYQNIPVEKISGTFETLSRSGSITLFWHLLFTLITMSIVLTGVRKGIEYWSKIMTRALFAILLVLFFYSMTLDGFGEAAHFIFYPDFSEFSFSSALEALGLAFFTLSLGQGIMISYGSYMRKEENIPQMAFVVGGSVILVATLAAMTIFPVIFTFGFAPQQGAGLIFKTLPYLFAQLPGALVISTVFFTLFVFTALTSAIPFIEVVATNIMELANWPRRRATLCVAAGTFLFGIPSALSFSGEFFPRWETVYGENFLMTIDGIVSTWIIPIGGLLTSLFIGWGLKREIASEEFPLGKRWQRFYQGWHFFMKWIIPLTIFLIILQKSGVINF
ncbi:sodium-dependent transporter [Candidatus Neptunochlamydia vexilliferae]|uniref:Transporter n=1 Tax=Candidatus Neptunichlamydia vexilliferae TaxID=1651774 RepID=A0ABS0AXW0_9BACT|nr:sodium-dependent transporter [Candidatus Neptunochlamydia vexilliferae]MBF5058962.1 putative sodium-dependent transporter YhdH [Candidatus Neptunochlamydia vexilliferae]